MGVKFDELKGEVVAAKTEVTRLITVSGNLKAENDSVKGELATAVDTIAAKDVTIALKDARIAELLAGNAGDVSDAEYDAVIADVRGIKQGASEAATLNDPAN